MKNQLELIEIEREFKKRKNQKIRGKSIKIIDNKEELLKNLEKI